MPGPKSDKVWSDAIRKAVHEYHEEKDENGIIRKTRWINHLAINLVKTASEGDVSAMKEIGDRLDGKPAQALTHANPDGSDLVFQVTLVGGEAQKDNRE